MERGGLHRTRVRDPGLRIAFAQRVERATRGHGRAQRAAALGRVGEAGAEPIPPGGQGARAVAEIGGNERLQPLAQRRG